MRHSYGRKALRIEALVQVVCFSAALAEETTQPDACQTHAGHSFVQVSLPQHPVRSNIIVQHVEERVSQPGGSVPASDKSLPAATAAPAATENIDVPLLSRGPYASSVPLELALAVTIILIAALVSFLVAQSKCGGRKTKLHAASFEPPEALGSIDDVDRVAIKSNQKPGAERHFVVPCLKGANRPEGDAEILDIRDSEGKVVFRAGVAAPHARQKGLLASALRPISLFAPASWGMRERPVITLYAVDDTAAHGRDGEGTVLAYCRFVESGGGKRSTYIDDAHDQHLGVLIPDGGVRADEVPDAGRCPSHRHVLSARELKKPLFFEGTCSSDAAPAISIMYGNQGCVAKTDPGPSTSSPNTYVPDSDTMGRKEEDVSVAIPNDSACYRLSINADTSALLILCGVLAIQLEEVLERRMSHPKSKSNAALALLAADSSSMSLPDRPPASDTPTPNPVKTMDDQLVATNSAVGCEGDASIVES